VNTINNGIQVSGGNFTADVVAVGDHASATKTVYGDSKQIADLVDELRHALQTLPLNAQQRALVEPDVEEVKNAAIAGDAAKAQSFLGRFVEKLKMAGVAIKETAAVYEPLVKLASAIGTTIAVLL
jgi:leucyl aminopeptidase